MRVMKLTKKRKTIGLQSGNRLKTQEIDLDNKFG